MAKKVMRFALSSKHEIINWWKRLNFQNTIVRVQVCKSFSEALILASLNPQYDKRLFIELQVRYMKIASSEHVVYINCSECQNKNNFVHNMYWACNFHVLNSKFNELSFVILWVSWCKNKCFWQRFTCNV